MHSAKSGYLSASEWRGGATHGRAAAELSDHHKRTKSPLARWGVQAAAVKPSERERGECILLSLIALALAAAAPSPAPEAPSPTPQAPAAALEASAPWWERITMTIDDHGKQQSCKYDSSLSLKPAEACQVDTSFRPTASDAGDVTGQYTKLTFERRFSPGARPDSGQLQPGDKRLAHEVMFLTIGSDGSVEGCRVVASSGDRPPEYGCEEARSERFEAQGSVASGAARHAFMTVLVYGHNEQLA
jgi:hypothetical protein